MQIKKMLSRKVCWISFNSKFCLTYITAYWHGVLNRIQIKFGSCEKSCSSYSSQLIIVVHIQNHRVKERQHKNHGIAFLLTSALTSVCMPPDVHLGDLMDLFVYTFPEMTKRCETKQYSFTDILDVRCANNSPTTAKSMGVLPVDLAWMVTLITVTSTFKWSDTRCTCQGFISYCIYIYSQRLVSMVLTGNMVHI